MEGSSKGYTKLYNLPPLGAALDWIWQSVSPQVSYMIKVVKIHNNDITVAFLKDFP